MIKGVRINLAAAICWENYMPLLRQTLYAQNINLYLAPTADAREAWLSLMRTVGIEGRCFVVSSNMCVREQDSPTSETGSSAVNGHGQNGNDLVPTQENTMRRRKSSCVTAEGFEIALPSPSVTKTKNKRRQSVFDQDGNEIVLCCKDTAIDEEGMTESPSTTTRQDMVKQVRDQAKAATQNGSARKFVSRGGSSIVSPFGDVLAGPQWEDEDGIIYADVDFDDCIRGRLDLDVAGSYSRYICNGQGMRPLLDCWLICVSQERLVQVLRPGPRPDATAILRTNVLPAVTTDLQDKGYHNSKCNLSVTLSLDNLDSHFLWASSP